MIYITFDRNILNGLIACGVSKIYYVNRDYSIFHIGDECFLHDVSAGGATPEGSVSAQELTNDSVMILYSFCPFEICGMYAAVSYFYKSRVSVYISRPPTSGGVRNVINYGDCAPEEILSGAERARLLSDMEKAAIHKRWVQLTAHQGNLRIWNGGDVENVCDEYYDADIQSAMAESIPLAEQRMRIQILLRNKYKIGLNPKFIDWRIKTLTQKGVWE